MAIGIFYGSSGGVTKDVAKLIKEELNIQADLIDISDATADDFDKYSGLILGTSTWGDGDLQDDWDDFFEEFKNIDLTGKNVALFGVGDGDIYPDTFLNGLGTLYAQTIKNGATVVGNNNPTKGYNFDESTACIDNKFVGLAIDEENQSELTKERVSKWVKDIKKYF